MRNYVVWLYPGFGVELKPFNVEADSEWDALDKVGRSLQGSAFTIDPDEYFEKTQELMLDGYSEEEAALILDQTWYAVNGGQFYLNIDGCQIKEAPEASGNRRARGSANRTVLPYRGGYVSLPSNYNRKSSKKPRKGLFGSRNVRTSGDLPPAVRSAFPTYIPRRAIRFPSGEVMIAEDAVELLDGQRDGEVSCWTTAEDSRGECWSVAFTFPLDYFLATPVSGLDWSAHISDVLHDPDASASANRRGGRHRDGNLQLPVSADAAHRRHRLRAGC